MFWYKFIDFFFRVNIRWYGINIDVINIDYEKIFFFFDVIGKVVLVYKLIGIDLFCIIVFLIIGYVIMYFKFVCILEVNLKKCLISSKFNYYYDLFYL